MLETMESKTAGRIHENNEPGWLVEKRLSAYELFKKKPMPNFVYGLNINLSIDLNLDNIETSNLGKPAREIIIKGRDVKILEFDDAIKKYQGLLKEKFMTEAVPAVDKFTLFHQAFVSNILLVHIPKNTEIKEPIE